MLAVLSSIGSEQNGKISFTTLFQLLGKAPQSASRAVTKVLPIDSVDEGELGKNLSIYYKAADKSSQNTETQVYLNALIKQMQKYKKKPFDYEVHILESDAPNAMALPGGVILVTKGLLNMVKSESELVSVLAHEMGHVELSHCLDSVKYEIVTKKFVHSSSGSLADFARNLLIRHSFSKTQEDEADNYGFQLLAQSEYDPTAMAKAFINLQKFSPETTYQKVNPLRDYFTSHPPLEQRIAKFSSEAEIWWHNNSEQKRYIGVENFKQRIDFSRKNFGESEWTQH